MKLRGGLLLAPICFGVFLFVQNVFLAQAESGSVADHVVISEIKIGSEESSKDEFVELYNPTNTDISLDGYKIYKYTEKSIQPEDKILLAEVSSGMSIPAYGHFLIAHEESSVEADIQYVTSTVSLSTDNTVFLENMNGEVIDLVGFGKANSFELSSAENPTNAKSIERLPGGTEGNGIDSENNGEDFIRTSPSPQNIASPVIVMSSPPVAEFSVSSTVSLMDVVFFDASTSADSDGDILTYSWDFGDGSTSSTIHSSITHQYGVAGEYIVNLTVSDTESLTGTTSHVVTVEESEEEEEESITEKILINEVMPYPNEGVEWIEFFNPGGTAIDITGWKLLDNAGTELLVGSVEPYGFLVVTSTSRFNNGGDLVLLRNEADEMIDRVYYGNYTDEFRTESEENAIAPHKGNTLARVQGASDTDNYKNDFFETTSPTQGALNVITPIEEEAEEESIPSSGGGNSSGGVSSSVLVAEGEIVINEFVSDPTDGSVEFVELYNKTNRSISLSGLYLEEGSGKQTFLSGGSLQPNGFLVVESPQGNLNNSGDSIALKNNNGTLIDSVSYGNWNDGEKENNAPVPEDPMSAIRKSDGVDTNNDKNDFVITNRITKGYSNAQNIQTEIQEEEKVTSISGIIINEVFPNPEGEDSEDEFIELKNETEKEVNISGWKLCDATDKKYEIQKSTLLPGAYVVFSRKETQIALNNSGKETIRLEDGSGNVISSITYNEGIQEKFSYSRGANNTWAWTETITPGSENIFSAEKNFEILYKHEVDLGELVEFDATSLAENHKAEIVWDFPEGEKTGSVVEYAFMKSGKQSFDVILYDGKIEIERETFEIQVFGGENYVGGNVFGDPKSLIISEIFPNPSGTDEVEFIELLNPTSLSIDLSYLMIDDGEGGSKGFVFPLGYVIDPGEYKVFFREETNVVLNNTEDVVRILSEYKISLKEVSYSDIVEGASYSYDILSGNYYWTESVTPGKENSIQVSVNKSTAKKTTSIKSIKKVKPLLEMTLENIYLADAGDQVKVKGTVAVLPGILGTQYFYITGSPGVQVYSFKKDFPELALGDEISVTGEISEVSGELRIKTQSQEDIQKTGVKHDLVPKSIEVADIEGMNPGWLVEVSGEITEAKSSQLYVDDGTEEILVYLKKATGINGRSYEIGDHVKVVGILGQTKSGTRLLPRFPEDIQVIKKSEENNENQIFGIESEKKDYITYTLFGILCLIGALYVREKGWIGKKG
ncbi:MAG: lamin tail domain-containing protein [Candidatus Magasanikbacteria bacterium]